jgi:hypothetical protein
MGAGKPRRQSRDLRDYVEGARPRSNLTDRYTRHSDWHFYVEHETKPTGRTVRIGIRKQAERIASRGRATRQCPDKSLRARLTNFGESILASIIGSAIYALIANQQVIILVLWIVPFVLSAQAPPPGCFSFGGRGDGRREGELGCSWTGLPFGNSPWAVATSVEPSRESLPRKPLDEAPGRDLLAAMNASTIATNWIAEPAATHRPTGAELGGLRRLFVRHTKNSRSHLDRVCVKTIRAAVLVVVTQRITIT